MAMFNNQIVTCQQNLGFAGFYWVLKWRPAFFGVGEATAKAVQKKYIQIQNMAVVKKQTLL